MTGVRARWNRGCSILCLTGLLWNWVGGTSWAEPRAYAAVTAVEAVSPRGADTLIPHVGSDFGNDAGLPGSSMPEVLAQQPQRPGPSPDDDVKRLQEEEKRREEKAREDAARKVKAAGMVTTGRTLKVVGAVAGIVTALAVGLAIAMPASKKNNDAAVLLSPFAGAGAGLVVGGLIYWSGSSMEKEGQRLGAESDRGKPVIGVALRVPF